VITMTLVNKTTRVLANPRHIVKIVEMKNCTTVYSTVFYVDCTHDTVNESPEDIEAMIENAY
jgi:hypothetical protein